MNLPIGCMMSQMMEFMEQRCGFMTCQNLSTALADINSRMDISIPAGFSIKSEFDLMAPAGVYLITKSKENLVYRIVKK